MNITIIIAVLGLWMTACAICGYRRWYLAFGGLLLLALGGNVLWIVSGLQADPLSANAIMAQVATVIYALSSFGLGWIISRFVMSWRDSRVKQK